MINSKTRTGLYEAQHKTSPVTPRASKLSRTGSKPENDSSHSPLQPGRLSIDNSPRSAESRLKSAESKSADRRAPKISTPERKVAKGSELQSRLDVVLEDLKKTKDLLQKTEIEKSNAIEELEAVKREVEVAKEKLGEALVLQKRAEESSEIEKFRAVELEQASIEVAQKIEEKWQSEIDLVKERHSAELSALLAANQEMDRMKQELAMVTEARNSALVHAENAMQIAEENANKVELLSGELVQMREALDATGASQLAASEEKAIVDAMCESKANEASELATQLSAEVETLKQELAKAKMAQDELMETEGVIAKLRIEIEDSKLSESMAVQLATELKKNAEILESEMGKVKSAERTANEYVISLLKQIEESNKFLQEAENEIISLKGSLESLEISLGKKQGDLEKSDMQIEAAKIEADSMMKTIESLKMEIERMEEEKLRADENQKSNILKLESLTEENSVLIDKLRIVREEEEKSKNAMDDLALALTEVSSETKKAKENLAVTQDQLADAHSQIEDLKLVLKVTEEKYQAMVDKAKQELDHYKDVALRNDLELQRARSDWEEKELNFVGHIKKSEEEIQTLQEESNKLADSLKISENEAKMVREETTKLQLSLNEVKSEVISLNEALKHAEDERHQLKEILHVKETELIRVTQENQEIHARESVSQEKIDELSKLLAAEISPKVEKDCQAMSDGDSVDVPDDLKSVDVTPGKKINDNSTLFDYSSNIEKKHEDMVSPQVDPAHLKEVSENNNENADENGKDDVDFLDVEVSTWESCKISEKGSSPKSNGHEPVDDDFYAKMDSDGLNQTNGLTSESVENGSDMLQKQQHKKKKKALLHKFGGLLKKKSSQK